MRIAQLVVVPLPSVELVDAAELPRASAATKASARPAADAPRAADPGLGPPPAGMARSSSAATRSAVGRTGSSRAAGCEAARRSSMHSSASSQEETGIAQPGGELPVEGPIAIVESISPDRSLWSKHIVHVVFAGRPRRLADGRGLERRGGPRPPALHTGRARRRHRPPADHAVPEALAAGRRVRLPRRPLGGVARRTLRPLRGPPPRARARPAATAWAWCSSSSGSSGSGSGSAPVACAIAHDRSRSASQGLRGRSGP